MKKWLPKVKLMAGITSHIKIYTDMTLKWVDFFSFQIYDLVVNFRIPYINEWEFFYVTIYR